MGKATIYSTITLSRLLDVRFQIVAAFFVVDALVF